ncbi:uncharacterized protein JCM15063_004986 [Sporobolomyces koalae]|uniref:uncharacterized protein n=1 Tax=Sporobolomyces koalae TaxID=500713 RepID=UPI003170F1C9
MAQPRGNVPPGGQPQEGGGLLSSPLVKAVLQAGAIWYITQTLFGSKNKAVDQSSVTPANLNHDPATAPTHTAASTGNVPPRQQAPVHPIYPPGTALDVAMQLSTLSDEEARANPASILKHPEPGLPGTKFEGVKWENNGVEQVWDTEWTVPTAVQNNASLYLDVFMVYSPLNYPPHLRDKIPLAGFDFDGVDLRPAEWVHMRKLLTRYMPQRKITKTKKLLASSSKDKKDDADDREAEDEEDSKAPRPVISYYHPNVSVELVCGSGALPYHTLPEAVKNHVHLAKQKTLEGDEIYMPPVYVNDFWLLKGHMNPINATTPTLPLRVTLKPTSHFKFQMFASMQDSFEKQATTPSPGGLAGGAGSGGEMDAIKTMLLETSPWLLITTALASVLHMLFEFLAFTADVKHWRGKKELVGVSVRTILVNVFTQIVVFLYLLDSSEETSWMIILSSGMSVAIEAWKITKAVDIKIVPATAGLLPYKLEIKDKHVLTEDEEKTKEYDKLAYKYVSWTMLPLLLAYTVYSVFYNEHKSWWSFAIATLYSFISIMGFVQLVPQLIINYKLKSVAHIPMKAMCYKSLNTVIDDLLAFCIKMPTLHRLACFRDDVVFVILLYQRYIYRVDPNRENEFGQKLTEEEAKKLLEAQEKKDKEPSTEEKETKKNQ